MQKGQILQFHEVKGSALIIYLSNCSASAGQGINAFAHSNVLKLMATGSNDFVIRLFNDFVTQMPQMELTGHKAPILAVEFVHISFLKAQTLLSYSKDVVRKLLVP